MKVDKTPIKDCFLITPQVFEDERGYFYETFHQEKFQVQTGIQTSFVQDNQSQSSKGVLRGLHFQKAPHQQAKLVRVVKGRVLDVVVDLRKDSPSFGQHYSAILDQENKQQLYIPRGCAHGFITLSDSSIFAYKCDAFYNREADSGIRYDDATLGIDWRLPKDEMIISEKDQNLPYFDPTNF